MHESIYEVKHNAFFLGFALAIFLNWIFIPGSVYDFNWVWQGRSKIGFWGCLLGIISFTVQIGFLVSTIPPSVSFDSSTLIKTSVMFL